MERYVGHNDLEHRPAWTVNPQGRIEVHRHGRGVSLGVHPTLGSIETLQVSIPLRLGPAAGPGEKPVPANRVAAGERLRAGAESFRYCARL